MNKLITFLAVLLITNNAFSQVVNSSTEVQPKTVKPGELGGSSFNGDVNLFTGTYSGSYTLGSVATPGGLIYDLNMAYSSSLSGGDNVPLTSGIPYGEGWQVQVPTITVSAADFKSYTDEKLAADAASNNAGGLVGGNEDNSKTFSGDGNLYWFSPMVNIPGVVSGRAVFKFLDPKSQAPVFVLQAFEQYIELKYEAGYWYVYLPDGTTYEFNPTTVGYRKGYNRRNENYSEDFSDVIDPLTPTNHAGAKFSKVKGNILPRSEVLSFHCSRISNRNMPHQFIYFSYKGFGEFNFFKEFAYADEPGEEGQNRINESIRPLPGPGPFSTASGVPNMDVFTDIFLKKVVSTYKREIDIVELEYKSEHAGNYGLDMLNFHHSNNGVERLDSLYSYKTVYSTNTNDFDNWKRFLHVKHPDIESYNGSNGILPSATNPYVAAAGTNVTGNYLREDISSGQSTLALKHSFIESPRLNTIELIGGDLYEIKTKVSKNTNNLSQGYANIDINILTGKPFQGSNSGQNLNLGNANVDAISAHARTQGYVNEPIFSTFGNAVKWNPRYHTNSQVITSNFFTLPNIPDDYNGFSIQIGPANSDNYFDLTPYDIIGVNATSSDCNTNPTLIQKNAHRSYWRENVLSNIPVWRNDPYNPYPSLIKQHYESVPSNFGVGLPWMMMKPISFYAAFPGVNPDENADLFKFWWKDELNGQPMNNYPCSNTSYDNIPTLCDENTIISDVELIRYSKNPYMLQSVKTYKTNGELTDSQHANPGKILVNQFDLNYKHTQTAIADNKVYDSNDPNNNQLVYTNRKTNIYLLESIQNVPVNGSQDPNNTLPLTNTDVPTTHFEYDIFEPGIPIGLGPNQEDQLNLRTNAALYVLNKVTNHLGKETSINYYPFDAPNKKFVFYKYLGKGAQNPILAKTINDRNYAVQINIPVESIEVYDPNSTLKKWNYDYEVPLYKYDRIITSSYGDQPAINSNYRGLQKGWQKTTITEPDINNLRPYSIYHHLGKVGPTNPGITNESMLYGKLNKVENFDGNGVIISEKEIEYEVTKAFINGIKRPGYHFRGDWTDYTQSPPQSNVDFWYYDYQDLDYPTDPNNQHHRPSINTGMGGVNLASFRSNFLETTSFGLQYADDSYFIKKIKETDTEYEAITCNIPANTGNDPIGNDPVLIPGSNLPLPEITNVLTKEGDDVLIDLINANRFGRNIEADLIAASPLSDQVLITLLDKRPFYRVKTYNDVLAAQSLLSDTVYAEILSLPNSFRDKVLRKALINQQYQLSESILMQLVNARPVAKDALVLNALNQYNALPEELLLAIINKNPKYSPGFLKTVLLNQVQLSEQVHNLILSKKYLPDNLIKQVFIDGASYPSENTLITMINRKPYIKNGVIKQVLTATPYQHTQNTITAVNARFGNLTAFMAQLQELLNLLPTWTAYCSNASTPTTLSIQNITEFEYWEANENGQTTSDGFYKLLDVDPNNHTSIDLMYEPSWQLYKTKSYSPQLPAAFTEKEYFYYYDLKNKYQRKPDYLDPQIYWSLTEQDADALSSGQGGFSVQPFDIVYQNNNWSIFFNDGVNSLRGFQPPGLEFSHELNMLNVVYQERTTSKNVFDVNPIQRSTFYHYDNRWNDIIDDSYVETIEYYSTDPCPPPPPTGNGDPYVDGGCVQIPKLHLVDITQVPQGHVVYITNQNIVYQCPCESDTTGFNVTQIYFDNCGTVTIGGSTARIAWTKDLLKTILLKEVNTQIDTLVNEEYFQALNDANEIVPFPSSTGLMEFKYAGEDPDYNGIIYEPLYPFDVLKVKEIKERNEFTQVQLEENERGLLTRYYYTLSENLFYLNTNTNCHPGFGNYSGFRHFDIGVPIAITVGFDRPDSLRTEYFYYPDYSVKEIVDPNGISLSYTYDEYGRLKESYRNGDLLSINKYSTWDNDFNDNFLARSKKNYVETFQLKDDGQTYALQSRKYIDPLGRDFHTMSRGVPDLYNLSLTANEVVHSGQINYDNWNRASETYKPFVDGDGITPAPWGYVPTSLATPNSITYPHISSYASYEDDQKSRVLREAKPGHNIGQNENVKYRYSMSNYICGGCELELNLQEAYEIMGGASSQAAVTFKVVEVEDEDGKVSKEYFNALGQKVATKQFIGGNEAITLFVYDSYGNLTKVINPEKQESTYEYNMLGWLFQKETVDGGVTKYMFNESGQVVLEQDENARNDKSCNGVTTGYDPTTGAPIIEYADAPYYRQYTYDIFGRLTMQEKVPYISLHPDIKQQLPLFYQDVTKNVLTSNIDNGNNYELFYDGIYYEADPNVITQGQPSYYPYYDAFIYKFSNNSTYAWKGTSYIYEYIPAGPISPSEFKAYNNQWLANNNHTNNFIEKRLFYGDVFSFNNSLIHSSTNNFISNLRFNMKGNLSHSITYNNSYCNQDEKPVKFDFYSYNNEGNLLWQIQQFNANGIDASSKGLATRIDYQKYDLNNNLITENVDVNNDLILDMQYHYTYDLRNRINKVRVSLDNSQNNGQLLASYEYNDATGLVKKTTYHKDCSTNSQKVDEIKYLYDVRDRLTNINSNFFDYELYYDGNMIPTSLNQQMNTIANFNGNINGTQAVYKFINNPAFNMSNYVSGSNFEKPTSYAYQYDGINRLTNADAFWDEQGNANTLASQSARYGDVSYQYDKIGNLTNLSRYIDANNNTHDWNYNYLNGTNRLMQVQTQNNNTTDRNYTYDAAGNLLTDDYRNVNQSIYGRVNLPFNLDLNSTQATQYLYDASDARVFKGLYNFAGGSAGDDELGITDLGVATDAEYYLRDAAGNTVGILNYNTAEWTWYVFGRERFARIKPKATQQPQFFAADNMRTADTLAANNPQFVNEVNDVLSSNTNGTSTQVQLLNIQCADSTCFWISENNLTNFTDTVADSSYTIANEIMINSPNQLLTINGVLVSTGVLTQSDTATADREIVMPDTITTNADAAASKKIAGIRFKYYADTEIENVYFYIYDHLGNTRAVYLPKVNDCSADNPFEYNLEYAADYYPYGKILREWNPNAEKFLTTHHQRDTETGLDYRGARYYDADVGRFLSLDPKQANYLSWSPYNYVFSNPLLYTDPDGRSPDKITVDDEGVVTKVEENDDPNTFFDEKGNQLEIHDVEKLDSKMTWKIFSEGDKVFEFISRDDFQKVLDDAGDIKWKWPMTANEMTIFAVRYAWASYTKYDFAYSFLQDRLGASQKQMIDLYYGDGFADGVPFVRFENTNTLYNLPDAGNFMWGKKGNDNNVPLSVLLRGANINEGGQDTGADTEAIITGYEY